MKKEIKTNNAPQPIGPYSQAIQTKNILFISGQIALDAKTGTPIKDFGKNGIIKIGSSPITPTIIDEQIIIGENKDEALISLKINQWLESKIKKNPSQWIWSHDRWK